MIIGETIRKKYYQALLTKSAELEGLFFWGLTTTGLFCRATCPARRANYENCVFFYTREQAQMQGFSPCQRCCPLVYPDHPHDCVAALLQSLSEQPNHRWSEKMITSEGWDPSTVRRQFNKRFGMTFIAYSRIQRLAAALYEIKQGQSVLDTQVKYGFQSHSGFRQASRKILPSNKHHIAESFLSADWIDTPLGAMLAIEHKGQLVYLHWVSSINVVKTIKEVEQSFRSTMIPQQTPLLLTVRSTLHHYFSGKPSTCHLPLHLNGSDIQRRLWQYCMTIPYGESETLKRVAQRLEITNRDHAVVNAAIQATPIAIFIPVHRITVSSFDSLLSLPISRSAWLLRKEQQVIEKNEG